jgi:hypothetical protein
MISDEYNSAHMLCRHQLLLASLVFASCMATCAVSEDRRAAERVLEHHFELLRTRRYDAALAGYDRQFFTEVTPAEWRGALASVADKLGTFRSYEVSGFEPVYKEVAGPGTYLRFQCTVTYSEQISEETFYLFRKQGAAAFKIIGHQIDAEALKR